MKTLEKIQIQSTKEHYSCDICKVAYDGDDVDISVVDYRAHYPDDVSTKYEYHICPRCWQGKLTKLIYDNFGILPYHGDVGYREEVDLISLDELERLIKLHANL